MDDPMRGVNVGTKAVVHEMMRADAAGGRILLLCSTKSEEMTPRDRLHVFRSGRIASEPVGDVITETRMSAASLTMDGSAA